MVKAKMCAPNKEGSNYTCFSYNTLKKIAKTLNQESKSKINLNLGKKKLWEAIKLNMSNKCDANNHETCLIEQNIINKSEINNTFRPKMPISWKKNKKEWLSTLDINSVMEQYEHKYNDFVYMGAVPSDCPENIWCELSNINLNKFKSSNKMRIGIIFNLDKHNQPGSHWVASYIDLRKNVVWYFDSNGFPPIKSIFNFLNKMKKELEIINSANPEFGYNARRHQYGNSECGIYSMHFIINCLQGKTLKNISKKRIPDSRMNQLRYFFYRK